jgi:hypothetical protein
MVKAQYCSMATTASGLNLQNGPLTISQCVAKLGIRLSPLIVEV